MASPMKPASGGAPSYVIDAARSRFQVRATAGGLLASFGHNPVIAIRSFTGEAWFRAEEPERSSLRIEIDANSLEITNDVNEKDRQEMLRVMHEDVLETGHFPQIRFEGSGRQAVQIAPAMYRITLGGTLALHGVDRDVEVICNVTVDDNNLRANGEFTVKQTDFHIKLVSVAGGGLKLKDELKLSFDIAAHRRREAELQ